MCDGDWADPLGLLKGSTAKIFDPLGLQKGPGAKNWDPANLVGDDSEPVKIETEADRRASQPKTPSAALKKRSTTGVSIGGQVGVQI